MIWGLVAHDVAIVYDWLYSQGLWKAVVAVLVAAALGWVLRIGKRLKRIESHLDTSTPGGLTDVVKAVNRHVDREVE